MALIKVIYKNADGFDTEHSPSSDSVKFLSFQTANKELTDSKLSHLIDGADAADEHIHDARYYRQNQHISSTTGVAQAALPINTDSTGKLSTSFIKTAELNALLSHSALLNLSNDDHPQYLKTDGTRDLTGVQAYSSVLSITTDKQLTHKYYVDQAIMTANLGQEWYDSVITRIINPPASPATGARYLIDGALGTPTGVWAGHTNQVATYNGTSYNYQTPTTGTFVPVDNEQTVLYYFGGTAWTSKSFEVTTASTGIVKSGVDLQLDPASAGNGLSFASGVYNVNVDAIGLQITSDTLSIKALGVKSQNIDFGTTATQVSGKDIPLSDAGSYFTTKTTEAALQYLAGEIVLPGTTYTVGTGGLSKGDLVYVSGADTVTKYSSLTNTATCFALASVSASAGSTLKVVKNGAVLKGVGTSFTPGARYYWTGSSYSTSMPTTLGANVWRVGIAKNATDLEVQVDFIKVVSLLG